VTGSDPESGEPGLLRGAFRPRKAKRSENVGTERADAEKRVAAALKEKLPGPEDQNLFLQQAVDGYHEQDRRAERSERRATTLLGSISVITAIVGATGGILAGSDLLDHAGVRFFVAAILVLAIIVFGLSALYALQVVTARAFWRRPSTPPMLWNRVAKSGFELYVDVAAALIDSASVNQATADAKVRRLRRASQLYGGGLQLLLLAAVLFVALSAAFPADEDDKMGSERAKPSKKTTISQPKPGRTSQHSVAGLHRIGREGNRYVDSGGQSFHRVGQGENSLFVKE
jgi:hypothetical protein